MSNVVRNGFSTLNRLLGKKNKNGSNGGLSKSSTNLNRSTTNLDATSQHNKITPLATSTNAPFEQTFRITICLPLDQLYVARVGAKTKLVDVLAMVCTNKLLDPSKFEFRHPTDDKQVFALDLTIGEVGLNEIRLAPKSQHSAIPTEEIKLRSNSNPNVLHSNHVHSEYQRFSIINQNSARPHTISASPYSSTNSLNSIDSSGPNSSLRSNLMPSAPCRKKRVAPRPPSQNSIPEDKEQNVEKKNDVVLDDGVFKRPQLIRQNFHVSSPNLTQTNLSRCTKNESIADISLTDSEPTTIDATADDSTLSRPLSMQLHEDEMTQEHSYGSQTHSRTSSDTSDNMTRDGNWPEPAPRKRIFIGKKKAAPSPPPRISSVNHVPVATPRNILQKLTEEQSKEIEEVVESKCEEIVPRTSTAASVTKLETIEQAVSEPKPDVEPMPKLNVNVSKVMLNVDATIIGHESNANESTEHIFSHKIIQTSDASLKNGGRNVSRTQINGTTSETISSTPKKKSISVVELNVDRSDAAEIEKRFTELEHAELSKEVNEIIDKAIEINEARLEAAINGDDWLPDKVDEVNNNHTFDAKSDSPLWIYTLPAPPTFADGKTIAPIKSDEKYMENDSGVCAASPKGSDLSDEDLKTIAAVAERPIEPIISEKSPIDFHHDASTYSTLSTEPESLRTSDIEDGYKGNSTNHVTQVNGEQFVENEFEFLTNERYDGESSASPSPCLMKEESIEILAPPKIAAGKADVIEELTTIISSNRLDTVIKPSDEIDAIETANKRSTLINFQIGAYNGNGHHDNVCPKPVVPTPVEASPAEPRYKRHSLVENAFESNVNGLRRSSTPKRVSLTNGLGVDAGSNGHTDSNAMKVPKYVSRSKSFHSTLSWSAVRNANNENILESLAQTPPRSTSFMSLNGTQRGLSDATRQRSSSELSIADSPSLQSVKVLKSIINSSRKNSVSEQTATIRPSTTEKPIEVDANIAVTDTLPLHENASTNGNGKPKTEPKTWKYEGPPSINLSTWGDRPKSQVFIKSDNDYKFGGMSKMAALQKRFSAAIADTTETRETIAGDSDVRKLPIVRAVELKKTISTDRNCNPGDVASIDTIDSEVELRPARRPSYEISRIVSDKPNNYTTMTLGRVTKNTDDSSAKKPFAPTRSANTTTNGNGFVQRVVSFNGSSMHAPVVKGFKTVPISNGSIEQSNESRQEPLTQQQKPLVKFSTYEVAPPFSQFTLRKTGLKEKILDESNNNKINNNVSSGQLKGIYAAQRIVDEQKNKRNTVPTAPKPPPPPISQKPIGGARINGGNAMKRSQSVPVDPRNQLLDSIRNFNRTALKKY